LDRLRAVSFKKASGSLELDRVLPIDWLLFELSAARILQKGFRQPLTGPGSPSHASGLLFGPSAARILQKGFGQPPTHASGLFGPSAARILQKGFRQPRTGPLQSLGTSFKL